MSWIAVGVAAVGAVTSIAGGLSGKAAAEEAGEATAENILRTQRENLRRRRLDLAQKMGTIRASVAASNIQYGGSSQRYANVFEGEYRAEMNWENFKARMDARTAEKGGQLAGQQAMFAGVGQAIGFAGSAAGSLMAHGQNNPTGSGSPFYLGKGPGPG